MARAGRGPNWLLWSGMLVLTTATLVQFRAGIDQSHAVLTLLLVVLGASAAGGRWLGIGLACVSFAIIDYYFQPPYDRLSVNKPLDGVILVAFFATAAVTTELLARAHQEASAARERAAEVESLARLGAATLRYAAPAEALAAIGALVRETIGAATSVILSVDDDGNLVAHGELTAAQQRTAEGALIMRSPLLQRDGQSPVAFDLARPSPAPEPLLAHLLALPLAAEGKTIGVLVVCGEPLLSLDAGRRRYLSALTYYAALGIERMRLVREASNSESLREANRAKDQVLASVSHDLRTPLTTIKVLAQGAESRGEPSAPAIVEQADRLARMVGDLLELSRIRAGGLAPEVELNTAEDVVGAALRRVEGILGDRRVEPHVDLDSPALVGCFDFVQTLRIVGNLLDNALRFTPAGGVVNLAVARDGDWLAFTVSDRGTGVAPAEQQRIFDAFYRPSGSQPDAGQAGLGLSIARKLAEMQHGTLVYRPRAGGGSEFTLRLPAADASEHVAQELD